MYTDKSQDKNVEMNIYAKKDIEKEKIFLKRT